MKIEYVSEVIHGLREAIGVNNMMAYIVMMSLRLIELHKVLKNTGSLYIHCDPTASHYLKIILDSIFRPENFRNEIIWRRTNSPKAQTAKFGTQHDVILMYSKSNDYFYQPAKRELDEKSMKPFRHDAKDGRGKYQTIALSNTTESGGFAKMKTWEWRGVKSRWIYNKKQLDEWWDDDRIHETTRTVDGVITKGYRKKDYLSDKEERGILVSDIWVDNEVAPIQSKERLGYATQKPISLLERIIKSSSKEGDLVLDPFCGCGTTVHAAQKLDRKWIGIDITHLAVGLMEKRIKKAFGIKPEVIGVPISLESAKELAKRDKFQFEEWAVTRIDGIHPNQKKVGDKGIDGRGKIYLGDVDGKPNYGKVIVSVKGGDNLNPSMVRDLKGTVEREKATFGIFMCIAKPTKNMELEAVTSGFIETPLKYQFPKIQIYTIQDYFDEKPPLLPNREDYLKVNKEKLMDKTEITRIDDYTPKK